MKSYTAPVITTERIELGVFGSYNSGGGSKGWGTGTAAHPWYWWIFNFWRMF